MYDFVVFRIGPTDRLDWRLGSASLPVNSVPLYAEGLDIEGNPAGVLLGGAGLSWPYDCSAGPTLREYIMQVHAELSADDETVGETPTGRFPEGAEAERQYRDMEASHAEQVAAEQAVFDGTAPRPRW